MRQLLFTFVLFYTAISFGQKISEKTLHKTESPYLQINQKDVLIPLQKSKTTVNITGTIAYVRLTQVYQNKGTTPIEAKYVFPMALEAAVHDMKMTIGDRVINAKIFEKKQAEKVYQDAVASGKRAAKLDQMRPNIFQMNVGNIMPGDQITIDVYYTEILTPTNGEYQFVAPGVVGPRYTGENASGETAFHQPYTKKGIAETFDFDLQVTLNAGMTIQHIKSQSHKINITYPQQHTAAIFLSKSNENPANRDFILNYSLRGNAIRSGLLLYEHNDEKFFAYMMEPPAKVTSKQITAREYLFIVDVSGSMNGYPLEVSKDLMRNLLCGLNLQDTFNVQLFASSATVFSTLPVIASEKNIVQAIAFLSKGQGGGGTRLLNALETAYKLPRANTGSARSIVVITDGYVSVEKEVFQMIANKLDKANVFTFGIGSSVNRYLIEGMAKVANTQSFIATTKEAASEMAQKFKEYIASPLLTQVKFSTKNFEVYDVEPKTIPDVFAARPVLIFGKYRGEAEGSISITGYQGKKKIKQTFNVSEGTLSNNNKALRYLWARKRIAQLDDYNTCFGEDVKAAVTQLGLAYNVATKYTSFVAVDTQIVNKEESRKTVKQPVPMPQNVNNTAVGAAAEITGKSVMKKRNREKENKRTPEVAIDVNKAERLELNTWFDKYYSKLSKEYLRAFGRLRFKFGAHGKLITIEVFTGGVWKASSDILKVFLEVKTKRAPLHKPFTFYKILGKNGCSCG
jgi:Ca-activated chloride channel family protein